MSKYLISTTEVYRVADGAEAEALVVEAKADNKYELKKYNCENKVRMSKGEFEDEWVKVSLTKVFNIEKEPDREIDIKYYPAGAVDEVVF